MKHTQGKWEYRIDKSGCPYVASNKKEMIADVNMAFVSAQEAIANAHLIAAAPEMYAALKEVEVLLKTQTGGCCLVSVLDAIKKAEGKE